MSGPWLIVTNQDHREGDKTFDSLVDADLEVGRLQWLTTCSNVIGRMYKAESVATFEARQRVKLAALAAAHTLAA